MEQILTEDIFADYDKEAILVLDPNDTVNISISLAISKVDELVSKERGSNT